MAIDSEVRINEDEGRNKSYYDPKLTALINSDPLADEPKLHTPESSKQEFKRTLNPFRNISRLFKRPNSEKSNSSRPPQAVRMEDYNPKIHDRVRRTVTTPSETLKNQAEVNRLTVKDEAERYGQEFLKSATMIAQENPNKITSLRELVEITGPSLDEETKNKYLEEDRQHVVNEILVPSMALPGSDYMNNLRRVLSAEDCNAIELMLIDRMAKKVKSKDILDSEKEWIKTWQSFFKENPELSDKKPMGEKLRRGKEAVFSEFAKYKVFGIPVSEILTSALVSTAVKEGVKAGLVVAGFQGFAIAVGAGAAAGAVRGGYKEYIKQLKQEKAERQGINDPKEIKKLKIDWKEKWQNRRFNKKIAVGMALGAGAGAAGALIGFGIHELNVDHIEDTKQALSQAGSFVKDIFKEVRIPIEAPHPDVYGLGVDMDPKQYGLDPNPPTLSNPTLLPESDTAPEIAPEASKPTIENWYPDNLPPNTKEYLDQAILNNDNFTLHPPLLEPDPDTGSLEFSSLKGLAEGEIGKWIFSNPEIKDQYIQQFLDTNPQIGGNPITKDELIASLNQDFNPFDGKHKMFYDFVTNQPEFQNSYPNAVDSLTKLMSLKNSELPINPIQGDKILHNTSFISPTKSFTMNVIPKLMGK